MKNPTVVVLALITGFLLMPMGICADEPLSESHSAQEFVQDFYTWYMQDINSDRNMSLVEFALKMKPQFFSEKIVKGLTEDIEAQSKSPDYVVGIDFDPFLNGQDTCEPYRTGKVTFVGHAYRVEVFGQGSCEHRKQPDVIPAVERRNGSWVFVDFYYPGDGDLFSALRLAKKEREKTKK